MPYESMPDLPELLREAGQPGVFDALVNFSEQSNKMPATVPARVKRSAEFMAAMCELMDTQDPEAAFRDALREMMHAAVEFGVDWTAEDRAGWADVRRERAALRCSGVPG